VKEFFTKSENHREVLADYSCEIELVETYRVLRGLPQCILVFRRKWERKWRNKKDGHVSYGIGSDRVEMNM
jgi:hypothetical protein